MDEDTVTEEWLVVKVGEEPPSKGRIPRGDRKLKVSTVKVIQTQRDSESTVAPLEEAIAKAYGHPLTEDKFLVVPLEEASIVTVRPKVEMNWETFSSYEDL